MGLQVLLFWVLSVFILIFHCGAVDSAQIRKKEESNSSSQVVATQERTHSSVDFSVASFAGHFGQTSLQGFQPYSPYFLRNECRLGWPLEMLIMYENKWKESCLLRSVWRHMAEWYSPPDTGPARRSTELDLQSMVRLAESGKAKLGQVLLFFPKLIQKASASPQSRASTTKAERHKCAAEQR